MIYVAYNILGIEITKKKILHTIENSTKTEAEIKSMSDVEKTANPTFDAILR